MTLTSITNAQCGWLKGFVSNKETEESIPFAYIVLLQGSSIIKATSCSYEGHYTMKSIVPEKYDMRISSPGFQSVLVKGVPIVKGRIEFLDIQMKPLNDSLKKIEVTKYMIPLIYLDTSRSGGGSKRN